jgi:hypothetical protein
LKNYEKYLAHFVEICEKEVLQDMNINVDEIPTIEPVAIFQYGERIIEYYRLKEIFVVVGYDEGDMKNCLMIIHDEDSRQKFFFHKKAVIDFTYIEDIQKRIRECEYAEQLRKQEPEKNWQIYKVIYIDPTLLDK